MVRVPASCLFLLVLATSFARAAEAPESADWLAKVDPWVLDSSFAANTGETEFIVFLADQADVTSAARLPTKLAKGTYVFQKLIEAAQRAQPPVVRILNSLGVEYRPFWVANMIWVRGDMDVVQTMAERPDVARVLANPSVRAREPAPSKTPAAPQATAAVEWNIGRVRATNVWALGYAGQGVVVAGQDTGYQWNHPALVGHYRGWDGTNANHNYNWHDAIHTNDSHNSGTNPCGYDSLAPCDDNNHGTHTMGTMVGDDGAGNQIGMAPGAQWVGCRNMERGWGKPSTYAECFQWFIAPTDLNGENPDPSKAPDVINNSWYCPPDEGCTDPLMLQTIVENTRAAGIVVVVSAGNDGSGCSSVQYLPGIYEASFSVGATDSSDNIASFSSRGPVTADGSNRLKPNVSAPGVSIRSSVTGSSYAGGWNGTSMAGPHVAGQVALLISAHPGLRGWPDNIQTLIERTAVPRTTTQNCGSVPGSQIPNNTYGWGRIDAFASLGLGDADGDGMTEYAEILAGTDPDDPLSVLRITSISSSGDDYLISFTTETNQNYRLERTDNLDAPSWDTVTNDVAGTGSILPLPDPGAVTNGALYYRIGLLP